MSWKGLENILEDGCNVYNSPETGDICILFFKIRLLCDALESLLELVLVDHAGLKLTEIHLPLPTEC